MHPYYPRGGQGLTVFGEVVHIMYEWCHLSSKQQMVYRLCSNSFHVAIKTYW